ncbi:alanine racemase [Risungbinella massiliensis]|uniref:alanine racemase n=1 Tax=Risungbinella massiliensis TaxID=1329796 RepID=UPI0005CC7F5C|nr:alanine racemase [Risungbinella massiliensis]
MKQPFLGRDTWAEIDLDAITHNVHQFQKWIPKKTKILCAVKANAYGHGSVPVAKAVVEAGADYLGVAFLDEALELRAAGITASILVMGVTPPHAMERAIKEKITLSIPDESYYLELEKIASRLRQKVKYHLKVDTGMSRLGLKPQEVVPFLQKVAGSAFVELEGLFTHYATSDDRDKSYYERQFRLFDEMVQQIKSSGFDIPLIHASNSAGAIEFPERSYDMIRMGISLYGFYPSQEVHQTLSLRPAMSLHSKVGMIKQVPADVGISYGKIYQTTKEESIATLPIGYADGILRVLSNRGQVLIKGKRVPIVGRVCMDQLMIQVDEAMPVSIGEEVVFYGKQGEEQISVEEVARWMGTIHYEVTCLLDWRVPRIYKKNGKIVDVVNHLLPATSL